MTLPRLSLLAIAIALAGIMAQIIRAKREEAVLQSAFPEYTAYAERVPAFVPRWGRSNVSSPPVAVVGEHHDDAPRRLVA